MGITRNVRLKYRVYDSLGNLMRRFPTKEQAYNYKEAFGNKKWKVK